MRIAVDVREACKTIRTGKAQWTFGFISELLTRTNISVHLLSDTALPSAWKDLCSTGLHTYSILPVTGLRWHLTIAKMIQESRDVDLYLSPTSYIIPFLLGKRFPHVPIVHDLIAFRGEPHDRRATLIERLTLGRSVRTAAYVCTVSDTTKRDLRERYPSLTEENVIPVFAGPMTSQSEPKKQRQHIVCIATLCPRKNQLRLIEAYACLPKHIRDVHELILVGGRGWHDEEIVRLAQQTPGVAWKNYLPQEEYVMTLRTAAVFAFPSLYEGFGMPILDAFALGVPVLTSNVGSTKEVAGDAALLIDPLSVDSIAHGLERILSDINLREELVKKGSLRFREFSWKRSVDLFLEALKARAGLSHSLHSA